MRRRPQKHCPSSVGTDGRGSEHAVKRNWETLRRVLPYQRPHWKLAVLVLVLTLLAPLFGLLDRITLLILLSVSAVVLTASQGVFGVLEQYVSTKVEQHMILEFRSDLFRHAQRLSFAYHDQRLTGQFIAQINLQASGAGAIIVAIPRVLQSIATLVGMFAIALTINTTLTLLALLVVPFIYYSTGLYTRRIEPRLIKVRGMEGESLSIVHEAMAMLRVIVPFGLESHHYERFR